MNLQRERRVLRPDLPPRGFAAFREDGGVAEFVQLPPDGEDGHSLFTRSPEVWQARMLQFMRANGYP